MKTSNMQCNGFVRAMQWPTHFLQLKKGAKVKNLMERVTVILILPQFCRNRAAAVPRGQNIA